MIEGRFKTKQEFEEYVDGIRLVWNNFSDESDWRFFPSNLLNQFVSGTYTIDYVNKIPLNKVYLVLKYCMTGSPYTIKPTPNSIKVQIFDDMVNFQLSVYGNDLIKVCYISSPEVVKAKPHLFTEISKIYDSQN
jgi:hypothetical protein